MIQGAHVILYSTDADADRAFFRDVLKYRYADAGHGWLIFALPPAEVAMHPGDTNDVHALYLMCEDIRSFIAEMTSKGVSTSPVHEERWGLITQITLPSGSKLGVYEPRHASPVLEPAEDGGAASVRRKRPAKKAKPRVAKARARVRKGAKK
jgi:catechol 2,3-dioxygenase-like lactoylglutathione lyase family enzyme